MAAKLAQGSWDRTWAAMSKRDRHASATARPNSRAGEAGQRLPRHPGQRHHPGSDKRPQPGVPHPVEADRTVSTTSIVGAGLAGGVLAERLANGMGKRVLIIDKRDHIGGNTFDYHDAAGILVHKYGPHIFHTNSPEVDAVPLKVHRVARLRAPRARLGRRQAPAHPHQSHHHRTALQPFARRARHAGTSSPSAPKRNASSAPRRISSSAASVASSTRSSSATTPASSGGSTPPSSTVRSPAAFRSASTATTATSPTASRPCRSDGFTRLFERMLDSRNITVRTGVELRRRRPPLPRHPQNHLSPARSTSTSASATARCPTVRSSSSTRPTTASSFSRRPSSIIPTITNTPASPSSSTSPDRQAAEDQRRLRVPACRRRPVLSHPAPGERGALRPL